jgi:hypothetical protein
MTFDQYEANAKASIASIDKLIARRDEIKSKIVLSNAITVVRFPSGREMTVAEVIERKSSIIYRKSYLQNLRTQYNNALNMLVREQASVKANLEKRIENILGKGDALKGKDAEIKAITEGFLTENEPKLINPVNLKVLIDNLTAEIEEFDNEADFLLSESNTRTDIEVAD